MITRKLALGFRKAEAEQTQFKRYYNQFCCAYLQNGAFCRLKMTLGYDFVDRTYFVLKLQCYTHAELQGAVSKFKSPRYELFKT
jgi:hypothetical protein